MKLRFNQQPAKVTVTIEVPTGHTFYEELETHEITFDMIEGGRVEVHFIGQSPFRALDPDEYGPVTPYRCQGCGKTSRLVAHAPGCPVQAAWDKENSNDRASGVPDEDR